jgi:hypothetical protein
MKIGGARHEPFTAMRRRALAQAGAAVAGATAKVDSAEFLGIPEVEMTPAVRQALQALLTELDDLRSEVGRLKARLTEAEGLADRDALTPLLNRRAFVRELGRVKTFAQRYGGNAAGWHFLSGSPQEIARVWLEADSKSLAKALAERIIQELANGKEEKD